MNMNPYEHCKPSFKVQVYSFNHSVFFITSLTQIDLKRTLVYLFLLSSLFWKTNKKAFDITCKV